MEIPLLPLHYKALTSNVYVVYCCCKLSFVPQFLLLNLQHTIHGIFMRPFLHLVFSHGKFFKKSEMIYKLRQLCFLSIMWMNIDYLHYL